MLKAKLTYRSVKIAYLFERTNVRTHIHLVKSDYCIIVSHRVYTNTKPTTKNKKKNKNKWKEHTHEKLQRI